MEQNNFELLDEIEQDIPAQPAEKPELKEYEKLLLAERDRKDYEKALSLIKFGCFEQKEEATLDFNTLELVSTPKKFKGLYSLYRNMDTMQLMFVCPLVENNKGDVDERKDMKPYAYDVIYLEAMDNETFEMVSKAAKNNLRTAVSFAYKTSIVMYFIYIALVVVNSIYIFFQTISSGVVAALTSVLYNEDVYFAGLLISTILLVLAMIKYRKYKAE